MNHPTVGEPGLWQQAHPAGVAVRVPPPESAWTERGPMAGLVEMLRVLRRGLGRLLLWVLACCALTGFYLYKAVPDYVATTQIVLEPRRPVAGAPDSNGPPLDSAQADSQVQVAKSERNLRFVFDVLHLSDDPVFATRKAGLLSTVLGLLPGTAHPVVTEEQPSLDAARAFQAFADSVSVRRIGQSYALEVAFRAPNPQMAARLANSVTAAYIRDQIAFRAAAVQRGTEFLQGRIADIKAEQAIALDAVQRGIIPDVQFADSDARVVSAATEPLSQAFPQPPLMMTLAAVFGLLSGVGVLAIRHTLDRRVSSSQQIGQALGINCVGILPRVQGRRGMRQDPGELFFRAVIDSPDSAYAEALRVLRTAIFLGGRSTRHSAFGIVSWSPGEGRSSLASNLAHLIAGSREGVVLIDADFRNPTLTRMLVPDAAAGLGDTLLNHAAEVQVDQVALLDNLDFVPAVGQSRPADLNIYLGSAEMRQVLQGLCRDRNVVIDLAPMSVSSDAQAIGPLLDGVVLVVEVSRTTIDEVSEAITSLRAADTRLLGVVLNKMPLSSKQRTKRLALDAEGKSLV